MNKIFSWISNPTHNNKWDRMVLTKNGAYVAAHIIVDKDNVFTSSVVNLGSDTVTQTFPSLLAAKAFADFELKRQGFAS